MGTRHFRGHPPAEHIVHPFSAWVDAGTVHHTEDWSEQALLQTVASPWTRALEAPFGALLEQLSTVCQFIATTANPVGAIARFGPLRWATSSPGLGILQIDGGKITLDLQGIRSALVTGIDGPSMLPCGLRLYDASGAPLLSLTPATEHGTHAFRGFIAAHSTPSGALPPVLPAPRSRDRPPRSVNIDAALRAWHQRPIGRSIDRLLHEHGVTRQQFYNSVAGTVASPVSSREVVHLMRWMVSKRAPLLVQAGRAGVTSVARVFPEAVQVEDGDVELLGPQTLLRLDEASMQHCWVVTRDTHRGRMRQIELLDAAGDLAVCMGPTELGPAAALSNWSSASVDRR